MGYETDITVLDELKKKPFKPSDDSPVIQEDSAVPALEPAPSAPILLRNFEGLDDFNQPDGWLHRPPDPTLAVGLNHIGVMVNSEFAFYTRNGTLVAEESFRSWWSDVYTGTDFPFDPRIVYDHNANRWIMVTLAYESDASWYLLSISQGSDPIGSWWNWKLNGKLTYGGVDTWADYPDLGFDGISPVAGGAIYITSNQFTFTTPYDFKTSILNVLPKSGLYNGSGFTYWRLWDRTNEDGSQAFTLRTAWTHGNPGKEFLINSKSEGWDKVTVWNVVPNFPNAPTWTRQATVTIGTYSIPPDARQRGGTVELSTIDNRIYNCMYRNGYLYAAFTEAYDWGTENETEAAIRYLKIDTSTNNVSLDVRYGLDGYYYWFPAIYTDASDNIVIVFARSSTTEYAGIRYTGRKTTDTSTQPSAELKAGETYITGYRWGDYFGIGSDPADGSKVWIYGEWAKNCSLPPPFSSIWDWGTWIGEVGHYYETQQNLSETLSLTVSPVGKGAGKSLVGVFSLFDSVISAVAKSVSETWYTTEAFKTIDQYLRGFDEGFTHSDLISLGIIRSLSEEWKTTDTSDITANYLRVLSEGFAALDDFVNNVSKSLYEAITASDWIDTLFHYWRILGERLSFRESHSESYWPTEFPVMFDGVADLVHIDTNSPISAFSFSYSNKMLSFNVTGISGTQGFCNITIPHVLLGGPYTVRVDGSPLIPTEMSNATHSFLYFTYTLSTRKVEIIGTTVITEFPLAMIILTFSIALATLILYLRKRMLRPFL